MSFVYVSNEFKNIFEEILTVGWNGLWIPNCDNGGT
ncbi:hypothetical protein SLEP1_g59189 [Rubroshorea leprosula]|uniref:Uncharacterized protein n=1 Tax=Rubroshorea leprosula TaxID=152421 RepID=A0AAV5MRK5_9ROSI|nr:hypothetical protein SLEP1_g59189 [Rubroshorea leprosula]